MSWLPGYEPMVRHSMPGLMRAPTLTMLSGPGSAKRPVRSEPARREPDVKPAACAHSCGTDESRGTLRGAGPLTIEPAGDIRVQIGEQGTVAL